MRSRRACIGPSGSQHLQRITYLLEPASGNSDSLIRRENSLFRFSPNALPQRAKHRELCSMRAASRVRESGKPHDFPVKFPVSREKWPASGSLKTGSSAIKSQCSENHRVRWSCAPFSGQIRDCSRRKVTGESSPSPIRPECLKISLMPNMAVPFRYRNSAPGASRDSNTHRHRPIARSSLLTSCGDFPNYR